MTPWEYIRSLVERCRLVLVERSFVLQHELTATWDLMTDTNQLNERSGLPRIHAEPIAGINAARYRVQTRLAGFAMVYDEEPYEWQRPVYFKVTRRIIEGSPTTLLQMQFHLEAVDDAHTRVSLRCMLLPRFWPIAPILRLITHLQLHKIERYLKSVGDPGPKRRGLHRWVVPEQTAPSHPEIAPDLWGMLRAAIAHEPDEEVAAMRPRAYARAWGQPPFETVAAFLAAVACGLLAVRLEVVCPSCRLNVGKPNAYGHHRCHMCDIGIIGAPQDAFEVLFCPHPIVREVKPALFCPGGPARTPHVVEQVVVSKNGCAVLQLPSAQGNYRLFARGGDYCFVQIRREASTAYAATTLDSWQSHPYIVLRPESTLIVDSPHWWDIHIKLERIDEEEPAFLRPAQLWEMVLAQPATFEGLEPVLDQLRDELSRHS